MCCFPIHLDHFSTCGAHDLAPTVNRRVQNFSIKTLTFNAGPSYYERLLYSFKRSDYMPIVCHMDYGQIMFANMGFTFYFIQAIRITRLLLDALLKFDSS